VRASPSMVSNQSVTNNRLERRLTLAEDCAPRRRRGAGERSIRRAKSAILALSENMVKAPAWNWRRFQFNSALARRSSRLLTPSGRRDRSNVCMVVQPLASVNGCRITAGAGHPFTPQRSELGGAPARQCVAHRGFSSTDIDPLAAVGRPWAWRPKSARGSRVVR
jgi:hypothetical protein